MYALLVLHSTIKSVISSVKNLGLLNALHLYVPLSLKFMGYNDTVDFTPSMTFSTSCITRLFGLICTPVGSYQTILICIDLLSVLNWLIAMHTKFTF